MFFVFGFDHEVHGGVAGGEIVDSFGVGTEVFSDCGAGVTGFGVVLFRGDVFGVP